LLLLLLLLLLWLLQVGRVVLRLLTRAALLGRQVFDVFCSFIAWLQAQPRHQVIQH
jgi:hypothetical protein